jgi:3'-phosphoadenosine 5'-phosphosulfate sulfotransferase (PAPS reductase)/FAD synthetase
MSILTPEEKIQAAEALVHEELAQTSKNLCVTNSFQAEDMVLLHMVRQTIPDVPVIFLDTGYHFADVYTYRDRMAAAWRMNLINLLPELTVPQQEAQFGILNQTDPSRCCNLRKVKPLRCPRRLQTLVHRPASRAGQEPRRPPAHRRLRPAQQQDHPQNQPAR